MTRVKMAVLALALLAACGDDDVVTATTSTTTTLGIQTTSATTTTGPGAAALVLPFVDDFDGETTMTPLYFAENFAFEYLEGGILRITRMGGEGGFNMPGLYPGEHGDNIEVALTFRNTTPESGTERGIILLADPTMSTNYVMVLVNATGTGYIAPFIDGTIGDYVYFSFEVVSAAYDTEGFNTLVARLHGGNLSVSLNGVSLGGIEALPVTTGRLGVALQTNTNGDAMELDQFSVTAIP